MVLHVRACVADRQTNIGHRNESMLKKEGKELEETERAREMSCFVSREGLRFRQ